MSLSEKEFTLAYAVVIVVLLVFAFAADSGRSGNTERDVQRREARALEAAARDAKAAVMKELRDPESARFGQVWARSDLICGYVNARNGFGGYTGEQPFVFMRESGVAFVGGQFANRLFTQSCTPVP